MQDILIFPYSGTAIEALDCLGKDWRCVGFISDNQNILGQKLFGIEIYDRSALQTFSECKVLAVHGSPASFKNRKRVLDSLNIEHTRFATVIHPSACVSNHSTIGNNVLIMAGVVITANAVIEDHVIILPNSVIHHDSIIGESTLIGANVIVAGNVMVGNNSYLGAGSTIKNGVSLGMQVLVGMSANVVHSFPDSAKLKGNPARQFN